MSSGKTKPSGGSAELFDKLWHGLQPGIAHPNLETLPPERLSSDTVYYLEHETLRSDHYYRVVGDAIINVTRMGRSPSHETPLAVLSHITEATVSLLTEARPLVLLSDTPRLAPSMPYVVLFHPVVARTFPTAGTRDLGPRVYTLYPAYRCEFFGDEDREEAVFRKHNTKLATYDRDPTPAARMRFVRTKRKIWTTAGKLRLPFTFREVVHTVGSLAEDDGFAEIENFEHAVATIRHEEGEHVVEFDGHDTPLPTARVREWLDVFTMEGAEAMQAFLAEPS